jgi:uncharacterized membrane protein
VIQQDSFGLLCAPGASADCAARAYDINNDNQIVGSASEVIDAQGNRRATQFLWSPQGGITELPFLPRAINNLGTVIGGGGAPAYIWNAQEGARQLAANARVNAINDENIVVGCSDGQSRVPTIWLSPSEVLRLT